METARQPAVEPGNKTSVRWKIFITMLGLVSINYIDRASLSVAIPLISREFNLTPAIQGVILSSFFWTYTLLQIPGGMLADYFKPRIVIASATVLWGTFQGLAAVCTNGTSLVLARLGLGAAEAPIMSSGGKLNAMWMAKHERSRGAALFDGGAPLGAALGSLIITGLITAFRSWRAAFVVAGGGTVLAGIWAWYYVRNSPREHAHVNEAEASYIENANRIDHAEEPLNLSGRSVDFFKYRSVWCMCFGYMFFNILWYGLLTWMPTYLNNVQRLDISQAGGASSIAFFSGFVGEIVGGVIADRWKQAGGSPNLVIRTLCGVAAVVATVSIFLVAYARNRLLVVALLSSTLFFLRWCGLYWTIPSILGTRNKVGFLGGAMGLAGNTAGIITPIVVGIIVQYTGSYFLALMYFAVAGLALLLCSTLIDYETKLPV